MIMSERKTGDILFYIVFMFFLLFSTEQFQVSVDGKVIHVFYRNSMKVLIEGYRQEDGEHIFLILSV